MASLPPVAIRRGTAYLTLRQAGRQGLGSGGYYSHGEAQRHGLDLGEGEYGGYGDYPTIDGGDGWGIGGGLAHGGPGMGPGPTSNNITIAFKDGAQLTAVDLWERMRTRGGRREANSSLAALIGESV